MTIGEKIRNARIMRGLTVEELAAKIGISKSTMSRYETGAIPNIMSDKIEEIAIALDVSPSYLIGWNNGSGDIGSEEKHLLHLFRNLTDEGKAEAFKYLLLLQHEYAQEK